jgi:hypothetical protein
LETPWTQQPIVRSCSTRLPATCTARARGCAPRPGGARRAAQPQTLELQALTRQRADHIEARIAAVNQLAALLDEHWPGGKAIFATPHSDIALAFLDAYPTPQHAARLTPAQLEAFCARQGYSGPGPAASCSNGSAAPHWPLPGWASRSSPA